MYIIELRNYLLKPGTRDRFIAYFKEHFIESQNVLGAGTPGLFTIKNEPNRFFWIREFKSMEARSSFLPAFYGGEVWKQWGPAANDMMLEWHDVYLIKPLNDNVSSFAVRQGIMVIDLYVARDNQPGRLIDLLKKEWLPFFKHQGINNITLWVSEMTENDFPRLPVYQPENLLIVMTGYNSEEEYASMPDRLMISSGALADKIEVLVKDKNSLVLYPA